MQLTEYTITGNGGKSIHVYRWEPDNVLIGGVVQIAHGMVEHALRYEHLAGTLTDRGYAVIANDHRGHGQTDPDSRGYIANGDGFHLMTDDLNSIYLHIMKEYKEIPRFILGHSLGATLVLRLLQLYPLKPDGVLLSGPPDPSTSLIKAGAWLANLLGRIFGPSAKSPFLNQLTFGPAQKAFKPLRTEFDWLSRDKTEVDKYINDPACGFICSNSFFRDFLNGVHTTYKQHNLNKLEPDIPCYLVAGSRDPIANKNKGIRELFNRLKQTGFDDLVLKHYDDGRHEMLHELNQDEVIDDLVSWIDERAMDTVKNNNI